MDVDEKAYVSNYRGNRGKINVLWVLANPFEEMCSAGHS